MGRHRSLTGVARSEASGESEESEAVPTVVDLSTQTPQFLRQGSFGRTLAHHSKLTTHYPRLTTSSELLPVALENFQIDLAVYHDLNEVAIEPALSRLDS